MALADALHGLLRLPGATYSCVVERDTGRVLAEAGHGESGAGDGEGVVPYSVARWGTAVAAMFDSTSGDGLDDVMITGRRSYHLVRPLGAAAAVLVYLRLDRARSNLAAARRELAGVRWGSGADVGARPAEVSVGSGVSGSGASGSGGHDRAVPAAGRPRRPGDDEAAPRASPGGAAVPVVVPPPGGSSRSLPVASGEDGAPDPRRAAGELGPQTPRPQTPRPQTPRPQPGPHAARPQPGPQMLGSQTPGPQAPRPQIPLPRRAPGGRPSDPGGRRRGAGRPSGSGESVAPDGFVAPAVLGQSWARDPGTLRRLIAGLRRMP